MSTEFDKYAARGNEILNKLSKALQAPKDKSLRILTSVLHATRNHLSFEESLQVLSQLPMALKGLYADRWDATHEVRRIHHVEEFLDEVRSYDKELAGFDLGNNATAEQMVKVVYSVLSAYLTPGEFEDIMAALPRELKEFIKESLVKEPQQH